MVVKPVVGGDTNIWGSILNTAIDDLEALINERVEAALLGAKGNLITASAPGVPAAIAAGLDGQILTADSNAATGLAWGSPAALSAALPVYGTRTNLVVNPSFEVDAAGWGAVLGYPTVHARSTAWGAAGTACLALTTIGGGAGCLAGTTPYTATPVAAGRTYTLSASVRAATDTNSVNLRIDWRDAAQAALSSSSGQWWIDAVDPQRITLTATAPTGAAYASAIVQVADGGSFPDAPASQVHYFDAILFEEAGSAGAYFDGATTGYEWSGTAHNSTSRTARPTPTPGATYVDGAGKRWQGIRYNNVDYWAPQNGTVVFNAYNTPAANVPNNDNTWPLPLTADLDLLGGGGSSRYTCKVPGRYQFAGAVTFAFHATGYRQLYMFHNGGSMNTSVTLAPAVTTSSIGTYLPLRNVSLQMAINDYYELRPYQNSGAPLALSDTGSHRSNLQIAYVGPP